MHAGPIFEVLQKSINHMSKSRKKFLGNLLEQLQLETIRDRGNDKRWVGEVVNIAMILEDYMEYR